MAEPPRPTAALLALLVLLLAAPPARAQQAAPDSTGPEPGAPYVPTPMNVVAEMLRVADVSPRDTVYDLGSGDGRLPITAARLHGAHGVGVELDSGLVARSRRRARQAGVDSLVRFVRGDLFRTDLDPATVVTLYLFPAMNDSLRPRLLRRMEPGERVVSHDFDMGPWRPDSVVRVPEDAPAFDLFGELEEPRRPPGGLGAEVDSLLADPQVVQRHATIYLWVIPADVDGAWRVRLPEGGVRRVDLDQRFQELRVGGGATAAWVRADSVGLTLRSGGEVLRLRGRVAGDRIRGRTRDGRRWTARRLPGTEGSVLEWEGAARAPRP